MSGKASAWANPTDHRPANTLLQYYAQVIVDETTALLRCRVCHTLKPRVEFRKKQVKGGSRGLGRFASDCLGCRRVAS